MGHTGCELPLRREVEQRRREPAFRVHDILKDNAADFVRGNPGRAVRQVQSVLSKISAARRHFWGIMALVL
ncbi:MAG: hypothetical protein R3C59_08360 [Planctomycetaceae bacterium]